MKIFISTSHSLDAERHLWHSHAERGNEYNYDTGFVTLALLTLITL